MMTKTLAIALLGLGALATSGCFSRAHMTENYGRAYKQAFERQAVNPGAGATSKTPKGLDALEAGIVVETYRKQLTPGGGGASATSDLPTILLSPGAGSLGYSAPTAAPPMVTPAAPAK
jgi:hypothetical protein